MYVFDAHCDYLSSQPGRTQVTREAAAQVALRKSVLAVFEGRVPRREAIEKQIERFSLERPVPETFLSFEGLSWVGREEDTERIRALRPLWVGPVWNSANGFGGSCREDGPLTEWGRRRLEKLVSAGIAVDLSHAGERMFDSCLDEFDRVLVSHACVFEVCPHPRNLKMERIRRLIRRRAFFGLTFYPPFVGASGAEALWPHIDAVLSAGGEDVLGWGSDLDGCDTLIGQAQDARVFCEVREVCLKKNLPSRLLDKMDHGNLENFLLPSGAKSG